MRLTELTAPFFLFLVLFRKRVGKGPLDPAWVRERLEEIFDRMEANARGAPDLAAGWSRVKPALVYLADAVILESTWEHRGDWRQSLLETKVLGTAQGGEGFFERLREVGFGDPEVAEVFLTCLALGFGGKYRSKPGELRRLQQEIAPRAGVDARALEGRLCPAAYESLEERDFTRLPAARAMRLAALFVVLVVGLFVAGVIVHERL